MGVGAKFCSSSSPEEFTLCAFAVLIIANKPNICEIAYITMSIYVWRSLGMVVSLQILLEVIQIAGKCLEMFVMLWICVYEQWRLCRATPDCVFM